MVIAHNISAINTYKSLGMSGGSVNKAMEKLASGFRINKAADDAAGLSISEKMRSQIRGLNQASENAENGISLIQTAEGALNEVHSILQRMRELAVQSATDTNATEDRQALQSEMEQLFNEIDRIGETTEFNGMKLLTGERSFETKDGFYGEIKSPYVTLDSSFDKGGYQSKISTTCGELKHVADNSKNYANYYGGTIDLSGIDSADKVQTLKGTGFTATCYWETETVSVRFVDGDKYTIKPGDGYNFGDTISADENDIDKPLVIELGVDGCSSGSDVIKKLISTTETINEELRKIGKDTEPQEADHIDLSEYGLSDNQLNTEQANVHFKSQTTDKGYKFVSTYEFYSTGKTDTLLRNKINRLTVYLGAEYDSATDTYGSILYVTDPTESAAADNTDATEPKKGMIKNGVWGKPTIMKTEDRELHLHVGANSNQTINVKLASISCMDLELGKLEEGGTFTRFDILTRANANSAINKIDNAIKSVSNTRSTFGAIQNRLEYTINNLHTTAENMTAAESTIRDVDMAEEMMEYTKSTILQQAAQAMLVQANARPQQALQLLR